MKMHSLRLLKTWLSNRRLTFRSWILHWWGNVRKKKKSWRLVSRHNVLLMLKHCLRNWRTSTLLQWISWQKSWARSTTRHKHRWRLHWLSSLTRKVVNSSQHCSSHARIKPRPLSSLWSPSVWVKRMTWWKLRTMNAPTSWAILKKTCLTLVMMKRETWKEALLLLMLSLKSRWTTLGTSSACRRRLK